VKLKFYIKKNYEYKAISLKSKKAILKLFISIF